jgi:hypothetical protein
MTQTSHAALEELGQQDAGQIKVPGYGFRWCNVSQRYRHGWGIWTPVDRSSELGQQVVPQLRVGNDKFVGANAESSFIYQGTDSVLAYSTIEKINALKERNASKAEDRIRSVDAAELRRNVIIPASGGYAKSIGGNS